MIYLYTTKEDDWVLHRFYNKKDMRFYSVLIYPRRIVFFKIYCNMHGLVSASDTMRGFEYHIKREKIGMYNTNMKYVELENILLKVLLHDIFI